jgi:hypothetical protein
MTNIDMCYKCPKRRMVELDGRTVTCHAVCPEYKEARAKRDEELHADLQQAELVRGYFVDKVKGRMT